MQDNTNNISGAAVYGSPATKKKVSVPMVIVTLIAIAGVVCAVIFGIMAFSKNKDTSTAANNATTNTSANTSAEPTTTTPQGTNVENVTIEENNVTVTGANAAILAANNSKINNPASDATYEFTALGDLMTISISTADPNAVRVYVDWEKVHSWYHDESIKSSGQDEFNVTLNQRISDIALGTFGQAIVGNVVLILMEDGTVKYDLLDNIAKSGNLNLKDVPGLNNIIKFYDAGVHFKVGGHYSTLAQAADGTMYDLESIIIPR